MTRWPWISRRRVDETLMNAEARADAAELVSEAVRGVLHARRKEHRAAVEDLRQERLRSQIAETDADALRAEVERLSAALDAERYLLGVACDRLDINGQGPAARTLRAAGGLPAPKGIEHRWAGHPTTAAEIVVGPDGSERVVLRTAPNADRPEPAP